MSSLVEDTRETAQWEDFPIDNIVLIPKEIDNPVEARKYLQSKEIMEELDRTFLNPVSACSAQYYKERISGLPDEFYGILEACSFTKPSIVRKQISNYQKRSRKKGRPCKNQPIFEIHRERREIQFN
jgi:hypothetical protein